MLLLGGPDLRCRSAEVAPRADVGRVHNPWFPLLFFLIPVLGVGCLVTTKNDKMYLLKSLAAAALASTALGATIPTFTQAQIDSGEAIRQLGKIAYDIAMARVAKSTSGCTKETVKIRKEW